MFTASHQGLPAQVPHNYVLDESMTDRQGGREVGSNTDIGIDSGRYLTHS